MRGIQLRLRVPLRLKTSDQRMIEVAAGQDFPPYVIPARTTFELVELSGRGAYVLDRGGNRVLIPLEILRRHAYLPRAAA